MAWEEGYTIGPQTDGTNMPAPVSIIAQPADTAGGQPAQYAQSVLDIFKYGIGAVAQNQQTAQMYDYKKFEATNGGLFQQGRAAVMPAAAQGGGMSGLVMAGIAAIVVLALITHRG